MARLRENGPRSWTGGRSRRPRAGRGRGPARKPGGDHRAARPGRLARSACASSLSRTKRPLTIHVLGVARASEARAAAGKSVTAQIGPRSRPRAARAPAIPRPPCATLPLGARPPARSVIDPLAVVLRRTRHVGPATARCAGTTRRNGRTRFASVRKNLRRAGVLKYRSFTSTVVPPWMRGRRRRWQTPALDSDARDFPRVRRAALRASASTSRHRGIDASASPRKPSVATFSRSDGGAIFEVAWRATASANARAGCRVRCP